MRVLSAFAKACSCNFQAVALSSKLSFGCSSIFALLAISACSGPVRVPAAGPILWRSPSRSAGRRLTAQIAGRVGLESRQYLAWLSFHFCLVS